MTRITFAMFFFCSLQCFAQSRAVPVTVQVQPPAPGQTIALKVSCGSLSRNECARFAKPTSVYVCDAPNTGTDCSSPGAEFGTSLATATGSDLTVTLVKEILTAGKGVQISYGEGKFKSGWQPVLPLDSQVQCCDFSDLPKIGARIPIGVTPFLEASGRDGTPRLCHEPGSNGSAANDWRWGFNVSPCKLEPGDFVSVLIEVHGNPKLLAKAASNGRPQKEEITRIQAGVSAVSQAPVQEAGICIPPYIPAAPGPVDTVSVVLGCLPSDNDPAEDLQFLVNNRLIDGKVIWSRTATSPLTYTAKLPFALQPGQIVKVFQARPLQHDSESPSQMVVAPPAPPATVFTVQEGATSVAGYAPGLSKVRVELVDGRDIKSRQDVSVDSTSNLFTASFTAPLQADQQLQVFGLSSTGVPSDVSVPVEVQPNGLDWGRVRGYFTAGVMLSNNNSQFNLTNANTFLGFTLDKSWLRLGQKVGSAGGGFAERIRFHTFFDVRLTAIPSGASSDSKNSSGAPTSLLSNSQAAALQMGGYVPLVLDSWDYRERSYGLYMAPIATAGFYTLTSVGSANTGGTFFPFYSYGLRLGHYREFHAWDGSLETSRAPEQLSYFDVSIGKWANFENSQQQRLWRYGFEGLLVIPNTPLIVGLSANVSAQHSRLSGAAPADDLRFLFGVRFDASRLTGVLAKIGQ
jgi:hypothetical protein